MAMRWILIVCMLLVLGTTPAMAMGLVPQVSGKVTSVDQALRTLTLGDNVFQVPAGVRGFNNLVPGASVLVHFDELDGKRVVTRIEAADPD